MDRIAWLKKRRKIAVQRYNELFAPNYEENWGVISKTHSVMFNKFLENLPGGPILDAACGSGMYWPLLFREGREIVGLDRSVAMLEIAREKFPEIKTYQRDLENIDFCKSFSGVVCIDALENLPPEEWPGILSRFFRALIPGGALYFTVELLGQKEIERAYQEGIEQGYPLVRGEVISDGGYHFYPSREQLQKWLKEKSWKLENQIEGDGYLHLIVSRGKED